MICVQGRWVDKNMEEKSREIEGSWELYIYCQGNNKKIISGYFSKFNSGIFDEYRLTSTVLIGDFSVRRHDFSV